MFDDVKSIINEWDPVGLISMGCSENEYEVEIAYIVSRLNPNHSDNKLAKLIYNEFAYSFSSDDIDYADCLIVARQINSLLKK